MLFQNRFSQYVCGIVGAIILALIFMLLLKQQTIYRQQESIVEMGNHISNFYAKLEACQNELKIKEMSFMNTIDLFNLKREIKEAKDEKNDTDFNRTFNGNFMFFKTQQD